MPGFYPTTRIVKQRGADLEHILVGDVVVHNQADPAWKDAVIANAGGQCENVDKGYRCSNSNKSTMRAVSFRPGSKDPKDGAALCPSHADSIEGGANLENKPAKATPKQSSVRGFYPRS